MSIEAMKQARSVISSINAGKHHALAMSGETVFWQREEWVRWALDEVLPVLDQAIAEAEKQCQYPNCDYPCMDLPDCQAKETEALHRAFEELEAQPKVEQGPVQVTIKDFVKAVEGKEDMVGRPVYWAQWPNEGEA